MKKLQALAERGVGGEKETARKKLNKLLAANNMTESDLNNDKSFYFLFSYKNKLKMRLMCQCIYKVVGLEAQFYRTPGTRNKIGTYCTPAQKLEIELDFEFYSNLFDEEIDILTTAFIDKQNLFPDNAPSVDIDYKNMTPAEMGRLRKMKAYSDNIEKRKRASALLDTKEVN